MSHVSRNAKCPKKKRHFYSIKNLGTANNLKRGHFYRITND